MKPLFSTFLFVFFISCSGSSEENDNCRFLLDINVNLTIDLNLPQYSQLTFSGNSIYIPNHGNAGIIVATTGFDFFAWDAGDPNLPLSKCSVIEPSGLNGSSSCDDDGNTYNFITGVIENNDGLKCPLKNYRVQQTGNSLLIFN